MMIPRGKERRPTARRRPEDKEGESIFDDTGLPLTCQSHMGRWDARRVADPRGHGQAENSGSLKSYTIVAEKTAEGTLLSRQGEIPTSAAKEED